MSANRAADRAQIESDDVAAVRVRSTGDNAMRARNIMMDDLNALRSGEIFLLVPSDERAGVSTYGQHGGPSHSFGGQVHSRWHIR